MKEKILLVEDNVDLIEIMRVYLTHRGYRVLHAQNGFEAIETANSEIPDLVVMDVMLQDMDGVQIALELRKDAKTRHIPILALTAKTFSEADDEIMPKVFNDTLRKPANLRQFEAKIQKLLKEFGGGKNKSKENPF
ncbi:MAG TPA: response regulator [Candidatus Binatia bacterium]|nr:response regulator [Candidatus Binatia bacterium]